MMPKLTFKLYWQIYLALRTRARSFESRGPRPLLGSCPQGVALIPALAAAWPRVLEFGEFRGPLGDNSRATWVWGGFQGHLPDPGKNPKSGSTLGFQNLHRRSIESRVGGSAFLDPPRDRPALTTLGSDEASLLSLLKGPV